MALAAECVPCAHPAWPPCRHTLPPTLAARLLLLQAGQPTMGKLRRAAGLPITKYTACAALEELVEGNRRFVLVSTATAPAAGPLGLFPLRPRLQS
jgi:hypothetical protein